MVSKIYYLCHMNKENEIQKAVDRAYKTGSATYDGMTNRYYIILSKKGYAIFHPERVGNKIKDIYIADGITGDEVVKILKSK